jgi:hypothetical protein
MSERIDPGRGDQLAAAILKRAAKQHSNPAVKAVAVIFDEEIDECCRENLGPGTQADQVIRKILRVFEGGEK